MSKCQVRILPPRLLGGKGRSLLAGMPKMNINSLG